MWGLVPSPRGLVHIITVAAACPVGKALLRGHVGAGEPLSNRPGSDGAGLCTAQHGAVWPMSHSCCALRVSRLCLGDQRDGRASSATPAGKRATLPFFPGLTGWLSVQNQFPEEPKKGGWQLTLKSNS